MKTSLIFTFILLTLSIFAQSERPIKAGIGLIAPKNPYQYTLSKKPSDIYIDSTLKDTVPSINVKPYRFKPDYGVYHFICLKQTPKYFKLLINNKEVGYVKNDSLYNFQVWDSVLIGSTIERISKSNRLKYKPQSNSNLVNYPCKFDIFTVLELKQINNEFWLKVSFTDDCNPYPSLKGKQTVGWILWQKNNEILIETLLGC